MAVVDALRVRFFALAITTLTAVAATVVAAAPAEAACGSPGEYCQSIRVTVNFPSCGSGQRRNTRPVGATVPWTTYLGSTSTTANYSVQIDTVYLIKDSAGNWYQNAQFAKDCLIGSTIVWSQTYTKRLYWNGGPYTI